MTGTNMTGTNTFFAALLLVPLAAAFAAEPAQAVHVFNLTVNEAAVSFQTDAIQFQAGPPAVELQVGKDTMKLSPSGVTSMTKEACQTPMGPAQAQTWKWQDPRGYAFTWTVTRLAHWQGFTVKMTFSNQSKATVRLRKFILCSQRPEAVRVTGKPADWHLSTVDPHDCSRGGFNPSGDLATEAKRSFLDTLTLYTGRGATGLVMGAAGPAESDIRYSCDVKAGKVGLQVDSEMNDILVDPGESRRSEEMLVLVAPYEIAVTDLFRWMATTHGARTQRGPIFGWCSWYALSANIHEADVAGVVDFVSAHRDRLPMQVIQIDDGWQKAYGDWMIDTKKFPNGMKPIADKITAAGMIPGIWLCMVRTSKNGHHLDGTDNEFQDSTNPAVRDYIRKTLQERYADGYRYFKLDFNTFRTSKRHDQKKTRLQIARTAFKLYRESIGEDSYLCACVGGLNRGAIGYADGVRIATDSYHRWVKPYSGWCIPDAINGVGSMALSQGILFAADPDVAYTLPTEKFLSMPGLSEGLRSWYNYVGLLGGFMMTSDLLHKKPWDSPEAVRLLEILNPPAPDKGRAFDGQSDYWHRQFGFVARRPWGNFVSVNLLNPEDTPATLPLRGVPTQELGGRFHVWSFWDNRYLGVADETFVTDAVPGHASALLRLTALARDSSSPTLVGSNLHIAMGSAEIQVLTATADGVQVVLTDAGAREGALFFYSTKPLSLVKAAGCNVTAVAPAGENIWKVSLDGRQRGQAQTIELKAHQ